MESNLVQVLIYLPKYLGTFSIVNLVAVFIILPGLSGPSQSPVEFIDNLEARMGYIL